MIDEGRKRVIGIMAAIVPTENSILKKIGKVKEPRRANHSGFRSMTAASLGEVSPSRARRIVPVSIVSTSAPIFQHLD